MAITATVPIRDSLFSVGLDFGSDASNGEGRWLGIGVQCPGHGSQANLGRQALTYRPKTILNKQKRPDHWFWTCYTAYPYTRI